jgi:hypothetical protein
MRDREIKMLYKDGNFCYLFILEISKMPSLLEKLEDIFECCAQDIGNKLCNPQIQAKLVSYLKWRRIKTNYKNRNGDQTFICVDGLSNKGAHQLWAYGNLSYPYNSTVVQYFFIRHNIRLKNPYLPCLLMNHNSGIAYYPLELVLIDESPNYYPYMSYCKQRKLDEDFKRDVFQILKSEDDSEEEEKVNEKKKEAEFVMPVLPEDNEEESEDDESGLEEEEESEDESELEEEDDESGLDEKESKKGERDDVKEEKEEEVNITPGVQQFKEWSVEELEAYDHFLQKYVFSNEGEEEAEVLEFQARTRAQAVRAEADLRTKEEATERKEAAKKEEEQKQEKGKVEVPKEENVNPVELKQTKEPFIKRSILGDKFPPIYYSPPQHSRIGTIWRLEEGGKWNREMVYWALANV